MITLRRIAYWLIAASIALALPFSFTSLPDWLLLIGLFAGRMWLVVHDAHTEEDRSSVWASLMVWAVVHGLVLVSRPYFAPLAGLPLLSLPLIYWLMTRFSTLASAWTTSSFRVTTILIAIVGLLLSEIITAPFLVVVAPICMFIVAAHSYHAFSNQNGSRMLVAHWVALTVILWIGVGIFGGMTAMDVAFLLTTDRVGLVFVPIMADWMRFAALAVILGMGNQITADMRQENRRITGLSAYWLVLFGVIVSSLVKFCAGVGQLYLLLNLPIDAAETQALRRPMLTLASFWQLAIPLGLIIYLVQFYLRRPKF